MRDTNHRSVALNKPVIVISSTVYDRRALDTNSGIPLINSLNHLTYLTSNSGKVRETIAHDGALNRLMSLLQDCHLSLNEVIGKDNNNVSRHDRIRDMYDAKKRAQCSWKWTLAFQCLVLTGTRGTESIRKQVVAAGVIPLLATILDNYLIYHKNYDYIKNQPLEDKFKELSNQTNTYLYLDNADNKSINYMASLLGYKFGKDETVEEYMTDENHLDPMYTLPSDFQDIWDKNIYPDNSEELENLKSGIDKILKTVPVLSENTPKILTSEPNEENCFATDSDNSPIISVPRNFYCGKIIPKVDDVIWSLQLLAFISKYTYLKDQLQNVELIKSLSFRVVLDRAVEEYRLPNEVSFFDQNENWRKKTNNTSKDANFLNSDEETENEVEDSFEEKAEDVEIDDPFLNELKEFKQKLLQKESSKDTMIKKLNPYRHLNIDYKSGEPFTKESIRRDKENRLKHINDKHYKYNRMSKAVTNKIKNALHNEYKLNLFPLVEKFTAPMNNSPPILYWSSVIMRNSCRKDPITQIRQCSNFSCGKWEAHPRQFAKCRRCKRTKYCSRNCQLHAWTYHRYWCHEVTTSNTSSRNSVPNVTSPEAA